VRLEGVDGTQAGMAVCGLLHLVTLVAQAKGDEIADALLVVHDEDPRRIGHASSIGGGRVNPGSFSDSQRFLNRRAGERDGER
jgi:hypothetical protein